MPILEEDDLDQRAILWERLAGAGGDGQLVYEVPEEIWVDWRWRRSEGLSADGTRITLDAAVTVTRRLPLGSRLWLAPDASTDALEQWYTSGSAGQSDEVLRVATQTETRDSRGWETRYTVELQWDRDGD